MKKDLNSQVIREKFQMLISMDGQAKQRPDRSNNLALTNETVFYRNKQKIVQGLKTPKQHDQKSQLQNRFKEVVFTKSDIVKQISKLKPYLNQQKQQLTTVQVQDMQSKKISGQQKKKLSSVIIYLNKRLCQKLREQARQQKQFNSDRRKRQQEGWIYEVFYRKSQNLKAELANTQFKSGYALLTTVVQLYQNLTFNSRLIIFNVSEMKRVKYMQQKFQGGTLQFGFLSDAKLQLFDRMLFLLKNMARTSANRLFQNQLIKSLYAQY